MSRPSFPLGSAISAVAAVLAALVAAGVAALRLGSRQRPHLAALLATSPLHGLSTAAAHTRLIAARKGGEEQRRGGMAWTDVLGCCVGALRGAAQGMEVPADMRLIYTAALLLDEAPIHGMLHAPALKSHLPPSASAVDPRLCANVALRGCAVEQGWGVGVVYAVGGDTEEGGMVGMLEVKRDEGQGDWVPCAETSHTPLPPTTPNHPYHSQQHPNTHDTTTTTTTTTTEDDIAGTHVWPSPHSPLPSALLPSRVSTLSLRLARLLGLSGTALAVTAMGLRRAGVVVRAGGLRAVEAVALCRSALFHAPLLLPRASALGDSAMEGREVRGDGRGGRGGVEGGGGVDGAVWGGRGGANGADGVEVAAVLLADGVCLTAACASGVCVREEEGAGGKEVMGSGEEENGSGDEDRRGREEEMVAAAWAVLCGVGAAESRMAHWQHAVRQALAGEQDATHASAARDGGGEVGMLGGMGREGDERPGQGEGSVVGRVGGGEGGGGEERCSSGGAGESARGEREGVREDGGGGGEEGGEEGREVGGEVQLAWWLARCDGEGRAWMGASDDVDRAVLAALVNGMWCDGMVGGEEREGSAVVTRGEGEDVLSMCTHVLVECCATTCGSTGGNAGGSTCGSTGGSASGTICTSEAGVIGRADADGAAAKGGGGGEERVRGEMHGTGATLLGGLLDGCHVAWMDDSRRSHLVRQVQEMQQAGGWWALGRVSLASAAALRCCSPLLPLSPPFPSPPFSTFLPLALALLSSSHFAALHASHSHLV
ncbi:unnamed protein product [Closterium sp. Yama58-4]|nr:unnamed protein product [Closterium sp. Yama58-4]